MKCPNCKTDLWHNFFYGYLCRHCGWWDKPLPVFSQPVEETFGLEFFRRLMSGSPPPKKVATPEV